MKADEMHSLSDTQLLEDLEKAKQELFNLRFQMATRKLKNHQRLPAVKRDIARMMTVLRERELMRQYGGLDVEALREEMPARTKAETPRRRGLLGRSK
jgi:large subunit ribosomal protein L29